MLETLLAGTNLTEEQTQHTIEGLVEGAQQTQMAAFLVLLRAKVLFSLHEQQCPHSACMR